MVLVVVVRKLSSCWLPQQSSRLGGSGSIFNRARERCKNISPETVVVVVGGGGGGASGCGAAELFGLTCSV